jgi:hypothetical protein
MHGRTGSKEAAMKEGHRPRPGALADELDELFCDEDQTLCRWGRPCSCCLAERDEADAATILRETEHEDIL